MLLFARGASAQILPFAIEARRYHWLSEGLKSFVEEPHSAIDGVAQGEIINLTDRRARASRRCQLGVLHSLGPDGITRELLALASQVERAITPTIPAQLPLPHLVMPAHHDVRTSDVLAPRLYANLAAAADRGPADFAELLLVPGIGARTVRAVAMSSALPDSWSQMATWIPIPVP